ncbi:MATE family efflux transporter [Deltaproteobacteria bacterium OttesenSCG-928-K17]|nr:MATE family efflux transporter [Deltaproteobacteria bacterium OttesenSCG-928-K17]
MKSQTDTSIEKQSPSPALTTGEYLAVLLPFMFSTVTQPLMGAVNTAVMGQMPDPAYIAGVSLGAVLFNTIYWIFGFLRVGTSGYAAQALGTGAWEDKVMSFCRPLVVALAVSFVIILLQSSILSLFLKLVNPAADVAAITEQYFTILVWGAPFTLLNYVSLGWLMGQARIKATLIMQISSNVLNMLLCVVFVLSFGWGVAGAAWSSLIAQGYGCMVGLWLMHRHGGFSWWQVPYKILFKWRAFKELLSTSGNLMFRTLCLVTINNLFAASGAAFGTEVLAANAVLLQIQYVLSYLLDGMGNTASLFTGRAVGRRDLGLFNATLKTSLKWLLIIALILSSSYALFNTWLIAVFSQSLEVLVICAEYKNYVILYPICAGAGLMMYGMYTGATYTAPVRNMVIIATAAFIGCRAVLIPWLGNHGLWIAYLSYYASQSIFLAVFFKQLRRKTGFA